jgi:hypothetical protein
MRKTLALLAIAAGLAACDSPGRTVQITKAQISAFQANPDSAKQTAVEESLARLDLQVGELEKRGDPIQADLFRRQATRLRSDFQAAKMSQALNDAKKAIEGIGDAFKEAGKTIGEALKSSSDTNQP